MKSHLLDETDCQILNEVQRDCRQPIAQLAAKVHLSSSACHRRLKQLEDQGLIAHYSAVLEPVKLGYSIHFFVEVSVASQSEDALEEFESAVRAVPEILECYLMGGQSDYLLRVAARDADEYAQIHRSSITRLPGVSRIQSSLALRTIKPWRGYPVSLS